MDRRMRGVGRSGNNGEFGKRPGGRLLNRKKAMRRRGVAGDAHKVLDLAEMGGMVERDPRVEGGNGGEERGRKKMRVE
jgi:hypothetical protein